MSAVRKTALVSKECVACGSCERVCPLKAIVIYKGIYALVDETKCVGCGRCQRDCPASVIKIVAREAD